MDLAAWRDLIIVIWGIIGMVALVFICIIIFLFYKKIDPLLASSCLLVNRVEEMVDYADKEVFRPVTKLGSVLHGIIESISLFNKLFRKKDDDDDE